MELSGDEAATASPPEEAAAPSEQEGFERIAKTVDEVNKQMSKVLRYFKEHPAWVFDALTFLMIMQRYSRLVEKQFDRSSIDHEFNRHVAMARTQSALERRCGADDETASG